MEEQIQIMREIAEMLESALNEYSQATLPLAIKNIADNLKEDADQLEERQN